MAEKISFLQAKNAARHGAITVIASISLLPALSLAEVKSLDSDELTETYIKDSTIIVIPGVVKKSLEERERERKKKLASITISPGEAEKSDAEEQSEVRSVIDSNIERIEHAMKQADTQTEQLAILRQLQLSALPAPDSGLLQPQRPVPNIPGLQQLINSGALNGNFDFTPLLGGSGIQLERKDDYLIMGVGNLRGVDDINIPRELGNGGGPMFLTPRPGGGFDIQIQIPKD